MIYPHIDTVTADELVEALATGTDVWSLELGLGVDVVEILLIGSRKFVNVFVQDYIEGMMNPPHWTITRISPDDVQDIIDEMREEDDDE